MHGMCGTVGVHHMGLQEEHVTNQPAVETEVGRLQRSGRDVSTIPTVLSEWLASVMPGGIRPTVSVESGIVLANEGS